MTIHSFRSILPNVCINDLSGGLWVLLFSLKTEKSVSLTRRGLISVYQTWKIDRAVIKSQRYTDDLIIHSEKNRSER